MKNKSDNEFSFLFVPMQFCEYCTSERQNYQDIDRDKIGLQFMVVKHFYMEILPDSDLGGHSQHGILLILIKTSFPLPRTQQFV